MGYRYGMSIWDMGYRYGHSPYRYDHPGYRYGIWANDAGDDSIDNVILDIDMGYLVTMINVRGRVRHLRCRVTAGSGSEHRSSFGCCAHVIVHSCLHTPSYSSL